MIMVQNEQYREFAVLFPEQEKPKFIPSSKFLVSYNIEYAKKSSIP